MMKEEDLLNATIRIRGIIAEYPHSFSDVCSICESVKFSSFESLMIQNRGTSKKQKTEKGR